MPPLSLSPPPAPADSYFDLGAQLRAFPRGSPRWRGAGRTLRDIERMVAERRLPRAGRLLDSLMREVPEESWPGGPWPICLAFTDRYGGRRVLVKDRAATTPVVLANLAAGLVPVWIAYDTPQETLAWVLGGTLVDATDVLGTSVEVPGPEEARSGGAPPPAPPDQPVTSWAAVASAVGVSVDTLSRRRAEWDIPDDKPYFASVDEARAWYRRCQNGPKGLRPRESAPRRPTRPSTTGTTGTTLADLLAAKPSGRPGGGSAR